MEENDNKNLILALALSMLVMVGWFLFFGPEPQDPALQQEQASIETSVEGISSTATALLPRDDALAQMDRVPLKTSRLDGSISLLGGRLDDLTLTDYTVTIDDDSPNLSLLSPEESNQAYYVQSQFLPSQDLSADNLPGSDTEWALKSGEILTDTSPIVLTWTAPNGMVFDREFAVDQNFMFTITDRVENASDQAVTLRPYMYVSYLGADTRFDPEPVTRGTQSGFILHQGGIRNVDGKIVEDDFGDIQDADVAPNAPGIHVITDNVLEKGWAGITSKYWMTVITPESNTAFTSKLSYIDSTDTYFAETYFENTALAAGDTFENAVRVFSGAKEVSIIRDYRDLLSIDRFDDTVDWGWFYFFTKPIFTILHWLFGILGNMGIAIIGLTLIIKTLLFPLAYRSFVSMSRMKKLQPKMEEIKEAAGDDRQKLQQMTMELYRKEKVNPVSGCLPIVLQIPIFFSLYKVLYVTTELRHASFFGPWQDLSAADPTSFFNLFGLLPWAAPSGASILATVFIGILPIFLGISMYLTQKLNPTPTEPTQAMIFRWLPWVFMFFMSGFAAGLILYWITNNTLTFIQQYTIMRSQGVNPNVFGNIRGRDKKKEA